jgi:hypothetical protein
MGQLSFALLIAASLALTTYFGVAAWRTSEDWQTDTTSRVPAMQQHEWGPVPADR